MRSSLHRLAHAIVEDYIQGGDLSPGDRLPTVRELREKYQTSGTSMVNALSLLEEQGLIEKRHGVGCYIAEHACLKRSAVVSPKMMGYLGPFTASELALAIYEGLERVAGAHGYHLLTMGSRNNYESERQQLQHMVELGCEAIVITPAPRTRRQLQTDYLKSEFAEIPIVLVDIAHSEQKRSQVIFDNYRAGVDMTRLLIREGHRRIAFIDMDSPERDLMYKSTRDRHSGYLSALADAGLVAHPEDLWTIRHTPTDTEGPPLSKFPDGMMAELAPFLFSWQGLSEKPSAVIALEDTTAALTITLAQQLGVNVPGDLRVVGFDDTLLGRTCSVPFTTTKPDFVRAGELAAELAIQQVRGELREPVTYILPVPIKHRRAAASTYVAKP